MEVVICHPTSYLHNQCMFLQSDNAAALEEICPDYMRLHVVMAGSAGAPEDTIHDNIERGDSDPMADALAAHLDGTASVDFDEPTQLETQDFDEDFGPDPTQDSELFRTPNSPLTLSTANLNAATSECPIRLRPGMRPSETPSSS